MKDEIKIGMQFSAFDAKVKNKTQCLRIMKERKKEGRKKKKR